VFGGGCFWCTEAVFQMLKGVVSVKPGYTGGSVANPTYEQVSSSTTGHVEVTRVAYDPERIAYSDLLTVFFASHDPTQINRQGNDVGEQYRTVVFYTTDKQKQTAEDFIASIKNEGVNAVTTVEPLEIFYEAEDYHQKYFEKNKNATYCQIIIAPKVEKVQKRFKELLKENAAQ